MCQLHKEKNIFSIKTKGDNTCACAWHRLEIQQEVKKYPLLSNNY